LANAACYGIPNVQRVTAPREWGPKSGL
jgi:hypothetical protein